MWYARRYADRSRAPRLLTMPNANANLQDLTDAQATSQCYAVASIFSPEFIASLSSFCRFSSCS